MFEINIFAVDTLHKRKIEEGNKKGLNRRLWMMLIAFVLLLTLAAPLCGFVIKPFVLNLLNLNDCWSVRRDHLEFLVWLTLPFTAWAGPVAAISNYVAFAKLNPRKAKTSAN